MKKMMFLVLFTSSVFAQELINFQHQLFCVPTKSTIINSLNIVRVGQSVLDWPYSSETIKAKLVFDDYLEVVASGYEEIKLLNNQNNSRLLFSNAWIEIELLTSKEIWKNNSHNINLFAMLKQNRLVADQTYIELKCQSRLSAIKNSW
jgi:hypothetical protein